jgi:hypothetical protein
LEHAFGREDDFRLVEQKANSGGDMYHSICDHNSQIPWPQHYPKMAGQAFDRFGPLGQLFRAPNDINMGCNVHHSFWDSFGVGEHTEPLDDYRCFEILYDYLRDPDHHDREAFCKEIGPFVRMVRRIATDLNRPGDRLLIVLHVLLRDELSKALGSILPGLSVEYRILWLTNLGLVETGDVDESILRQRSHEKSLFEVNEKLIDACWPKSRNAPDVFREEFDKLWDIGHFIHV